jgi:hypothetical protein
MASWLLPVTLSLVCLVACDRDGALDTVVDSGLPPAVWHADAERVVSALPKRVGSFAPIEGAEPFSTSYATGPVFGAGCTYADGPRQLTLRIETGNVKARAAAAFEGRAGAKPAPHEVTVHGRPAAARWDAIARAAEVTFLVARRYLVQVRLVPAASEAEVLAMAEAFDVAPLEALVLDGVTP